MKNLSVKNLFALPLLSLALVACGKSEDEGVRNAPKIRGSSARNNISTNAAYHGDSSAGTQKALDQIKPVSSADDIMRANAAEETKREEMRLKAKAEERDSMQQMEYDLAEMQARDKRSKDAADMIKLGLFMEPMKAMMTPPGKSGCSNLGSAEQLMSDFVKANAVMTMVNP